MYLTNFYSYSIISEVFYGDEMTYSQAWLESPSSIRGILVEATVRDVVAAQEITMYLSNIGYMTQDSVTSYQPIISGGVQWTESLPIDGSPTLSFGDIQLLNLNGELDSWLDPTKYIWANRAIQVYIGDPFFKCANLAEVRTKFLKIFDGIISDVDTQSRERLNIKIQDKLGRLNVPLNNTKVGTYGSGSWTTSQTNQDDLLPLVFGEVFNITPKLVMPNVQEYQVNIGNTEDIIEIRDNGVPIYTSGGSLTGATLDLANGRFTLTNALQGTLTCSVQGVKNSINLGTSSDGTGALVSGTYYNNIANLIALIVTQYGPNKLTATDLDITNLRLFQNANTQPVGTYITDSTSVLQVCQDLANSVGAQLFMTRDGKLQLLRIGVPTADPSVTITDADILHHSLAISSRTAVEASKTLGYCKNWAVQTNLLTAIYPEDKTNFSTDIYTKTSRDSTVQTNYKLPADLKNQKDTLLLKGTHADAEALRLNNYYKVPRTVYSFIGTPKLLSLKLGQPVVLQHSRFGLSSGVSGQVVSLSPDWLNSSIRVEVII